MPPVSDPLKPALELALDVARISAKARPPVAPPGPLRPYLRFTKVTTPVLDAVRRAVDGDEGFRQRVALVAGEDDVGRAGYLWLHRPDGWQQELDDLLLAADSGEARSDGQEREEGQEREARRQIEAELRALRADLAAQRAEAVAQRKARAEAEDALAAALSEKLKLADDRSEAIRLLKAVEARAAQNAAERNQLRRRLRDQQEPSAVPSAPASQTDRPVPAPLPAPPEPPPARPDPPLAGSDPEAAGRALSEAAEAAASLARALGDLARSVRAERAADTARPAPRAAPPRPMAPPASPPPLPREPVSLPPGVLDDGPDAAYHLLRVSGAVLLVDGYNVTKSAWPDLAPAEQRARLVQALGTLTARTGIEIDAVFDGADIVASTPLLSPRGVRVRYSEPNIEADDVILKLVDEYPRTRAVVVASSDARVREGARRGGANVLHATQLLAAIRR
jgi:predicted RNA-binding protein with PIN domain